MAGYPERRTSSAAAWARGLAAFALTLFVVAALSHRYDLLDTVAFFWTLGIVGALVILAFCLAARGFHSFWVTGERVGRDATIAFVIGLIAASPFLASGYRFFAYPRLHDISTDLVQPPVMPEAAQRRTEQMNAVAPIGSAAAALQRESYPEVTGRRYAAPSDRVLESIVTLLQLRGWRLYAMTEPPAEGSTVTVEAQAGSFLLKLPADISVRLTDEETSSYVDMRSASRYGLHDFGDNALRISRFLRDLDAIVAALVAPPDAEAEEVVPGQAGDNVPVPTEPPPD